MYFLPFSPTPSKAKLSKEGYKGNVDRLHESQYDQYRQANDLDSRVIHWFSLANYYTQLPLLNNRRGLNPKDSDNQTPLFLAPRNGQKVVVKLPLAKNQDSKDIDNKTPLLRAVASRWWGYRWPRMSSTRAPAIQTIKVHSRRRRKMGKMR